MHCIYLADLTYHADLLIVKSPISCSTKKKIKTLTFIYYKWIPWISLPSFFINIKLNTFIFMCILNKICFYKKIKHKFSVMAFISGKPRIFKAGGTNLLSGQFFFQKLHPNEKNSTVRRGSSPNFVFFPPLLMEIKTTTSL